MVQFFPKTRQLHMRAQNGSNMLHDWQEGVIASCYWRIAQVIPVVWFASDCISKSGSIPYVGYVQTHGDECALAQTGERPGEIWLCRRNPSIVLFAKLDMPCYSDDHLSCTGRFLMSSGRGLGTACSDDHLHSSNVLMSGSVLLICWQ